MLRLQTHLSLTSNLTMNKLLFCVIFLLEKMDVQWLKSYHTGFDITNEKVIYQHFILSKIHTRPLLSGLPPLFLILSKMDNS